MADHKVKVDVTADDKATPVLSRLANFIKSRFVVTLGDITGAFRLVLGGIKKVADEAIEAEKSMSELSSAMKNAGTYTTEAFNAQNEFANSLQKSVIATDDQIRSTQAMLVSLAGLSGEGLNVTTKAVLDFAARTGTDAVSAAQLFGKTIGGEVNALARYGISVSGAAGSTERMESATKNAAILFGGAASAQTETFDGKLKQLNKSVGEVFETLSSESISGSKDYLDSLKDMVEGTENFLKSIKRRRDILLLSAQVEKYGYATLSADQAKFLLENKKETEKYSLSKRLDTQKLQDQLTRMEGIGQQDRANQESKNQKQSNVKSGAKKQEEDQKKAEKLLKKRKEEEAEREKKDIDDKNKREQAASEQMALNNDRVRKEQEEKDKAAAKEKLRVEEVLAQAILDVKTSFGNLQTIAVASQSKELFEIAKAGSIATATIDTYTAVNKALASLPWPASLIPAGAALAAGMSNVGLIMQQTPGFAQGGIVPGTATTGDNIPARVNSGEMILNKTQQKQLFEMANGNGGGSMTVNLMLDKKVLAKQIVDLQRQYNKGLI